MTDDTIRAALDDAVRAYCHADGDCPCSHGCHCLIAPNPDTRGGMADAIAAFLNAPPPSAQTIRLYLGEVSPQGMRDIYAYHRWLAAAVEEAARHD